jgi:high-affinity iron transporter
MIQFVLHADMIRTTLFFLGFLLTLSVSSQTKSEEDNARMLINLMDYIAKDYQMGVSNGEVISEFEYAEMHEFVGAAVTKADELDASGVLSNEKVIKAELDQLHGLIRDTAAATDVAKQADKVKELVLQQGLVALVPDQFPNLEKGKSLFAAQCASCHGTYGAGDGPAGQGLNPAPTNFRNKDIMVGVAPFQAYNTIRLGIPGTSMRAFKELSDEEIWDVAFYVLSLQHLDNRSAKTEIEIDIVDLASLSDEDLKVKYPSANVAAHRSKPQPVEVKKEITATNKAKSLLKKSLLAYESRDKMGALNAALKAYLDGVEPIEAQVQASDNALFGRLEADMMKVRSLIEQDASLEALEIAVITATETINEAEALLSSSERGVFDTALLTAGILIREGLEAFFVILAILGVLRKVNIPQAARWIHLGWIAAIAVGMISWFFTDSLMQWSAAERELMEGLIGIFAVGILLYLGYWLHGKTEAGKWKAFVEERILTLVNRNNLIGLSAFSFIVVFREAFESVLFISSLSAGGEGDSKIGILIGFIGSALLLFFIAVAMLRWFKKLPIKQVFQFSTIMVLTLAVILMGQGIHALQEGGYIGINSFPINLRISILGIYPTIESILSQVGIVLLIIGLWKLNERKTVSQ